jgi:DNA polymerase-1
LVGVDAKGIQLRVLAHYLNNPDFTEAVLNGDPHAYNQEIGGFRSRANAKTFIYAFLLGAGDGKIGQIVGGSTRDGRDLKARFIGNFPGLSNLLDDLEGQVRRVGRIRLCDGTPLIVTAPHTRLGYLLQGDESRIMKKAAILSAAMIKRRNLDVLKVGDIHDEWQSDTYAPHVDELANEVYPEAFRLSGEFFNYRLPIGCDTKIGMTWAETH